MSNPKDFCGDEWWVMCQVCNTNQCSVCNVNHRGQTYALVLRWFCDWSGTWSNSVVCDGKTVKGFPTKSDAEKAYART